MKNVSVTKSRFKTAVLVKAALLAAVSIILTRFFSYMVPLGGLPVLRIGFGNLPLIISGMMFGPLVGAVVGIVSDIVGYLINPMGGAYFPGFTLTAALYGFMSGILFQQLKIHKQRINFNIVNAVTIMLFAIGIFYLMLDKNVLAKVNGKWVFEDVSAVPLLILMFAVTVLFAGLPFVMNRWFSSTSKGIAFDKIAFTVTLTYVVNALILNTIWLSIMFEAGFVGMLPGRVIASVVTIPVYSWMIFSIGKFINLTEQ